MYYVCIENNVIASILNYEPAAPESITVVTITDAEEKSIRDQTHTFDISTKSVVPVAASVTAQKEQETANGQEREFLNSTDWKILRHLRQKALAVTTTMTESEYLALEQQRQDAAARII
jgi:hypothetical protein